MRSDIPSLPCAERPRRALPLRSGPRSRRTGKSACTRAKLFTASLIAATVPFTLGGIDNIARLALPAIASNDLGGTGIGDTTVVNLGRSGLGAVALLPG